MFWDEIIIECQNCSKELIGHPQDVDSIENEIYCPKCKIILDKDDYL